MKKLLLLFSLLPSFVLAQMYEVTPTGLRDTADLEKSYVVLDFEGKSVVELYEKSLGYINETMQNPKESIKVQEEDEHLRFSVYESSPFKYNNKGPKFPVSIKYDVDLRFKEGRIRYEITNLTMETSSYPVVFTGSKWTVYPVYERSGKLYNSEAKKDIENHFNTMIDIYKDYIEGVLNDDDW